MRRLLVMLTALPLLAGAAEHKVVALGGDITEIVYALGAQSELVARDTTSTWPAQARGLPDVGYLRQLSAEGILAAQKRSCKSFSRTRRASGHCAGQRPGAALPGAGAGCPERRSRDNAPGPGRYQRH